MSAQCREQAKFVAVVLFVDPSGASAEWSKGYINLPTDARVRQDFIDACAEEYRYRAPVDDAARVLLCRQHGALEFQVLFRPTGTPVLNSAGPRLDVFHLVPPAAHEVN